MVKGVSGHLDQIAQRAMQGKTYLYTTLGKLVPVTTLFGYQTATWRKHLGWPKEHDADAVCIATFESGEVVSYQRGRFYCVTFRPRRTRRQFHDLPRKGQGRVKYQVNSIYSNGYLAFRRVKGEPNAAKPQDCQLLERQRTILWERAGFATSIQDTL